MIPVRTYFNEWFENRLQELHINLLDLSRRTGYRLEYLKRLVKYALPSEMRARELAPFLRVSDIEILSILDKARQQRPGLACPFSKYFVSSLERNNTSVQEVSEILGIDVGVLSIMTHSRTAPKLPLAKQVVHILGDKWEDVEAIWLASVPQEQSVNEPVSNKADSMPVPLPAAELVCAPDEAPASPESETQPLGAKWHLRAFTNEIFGDTQRFRHSGIELSLNGKPYLTWSSSTACWILPDSTDPGPHPIPSEIMKLVLEYESLRSRIVIMGNVSVG